MRRCTCGSSLKAGTRLWQDLLVRLLGSWGDWCWYPCCFFFFTWEILFCFRQVLEGHSAQSAAQRLLWQSADSSEWKLPGGRGTGGATCCGWGPGWGAAVSTWYRLRLRHLQHFCVYVRFYFTCIKNCLLFYIPSQEGTASEKYTEPVQVETTEVGRLMSCFRNRLHL